DLHPGVRAGPVTKGTLVRLFFDAVDRFGGLPAALRYKVGGRWVALTHREVEERVRAVSVGLRELGIQPGDRVSIRSRNRPGGGGRGGERRPSPTSKPWAAARPRSTRSSAPRRWRWSRTSSPRSSIPPGRPAIPRGSCYPTTTSGPTSSARCR